MIRKFGTTRITYLFGNYAVKLPTIKSWSLFLNGLLCNIQERNYSRNIDHDNKLCPVLFSLWGGFMNIMPRCRELPRHTFYDFNFEEWSGSHILSDDKYIVTIDGLPVENKLDSFGLLNDKIVAVDYGSWDRISWIIKTE